jgi:hypothetical protein
MIDGELLRHRLGSHVDVTVHFSEGSHDLPDDLSGLAVGSYSASKPPRMSPPWASSDLALSW